MTRAIAACASVGVVAASSSARTERDPVGRDRDVHQHVGDAELVHVVAQLAQLRDELRLELAERAGRHGLLPQRAPERRKVESPLIHLVVNEAAEEPALCGLGTDETRSGRGTLEDQIRAPQEAAHPGQVGLEGGSADEQPVGRLEDVDALIAGEQRPHDRVEPIAGGSRIRRVRAQRGGRLGAGAVAQRP
ncbi:hypothetical protein [Microbacterium sp. SORGH_AS_0862]|uniref:hypothetical protein n=1 Tax=Microbacterium sp. SORGH_AS_0862 TaxID=3041789 RepID=UPI002791FB04|nr:hypothetical protein [Microbacterium sp. SORGH_AS_0862]MDQ1204271.1 hypothetical protein [Microbacterium sp. SORGH_AS_0862]